MQANDCHRHAAGQQQAEKGTHPTIQASGFVLCAHQSQTKTASRRQRKAHAFTDLCPLRLGAQPRRRAQHVQRNRQPDQNQWHGQQHFALRRPTVNQLLPQGGPQRVGIERQQGQGHRQASHRCVQA